MTIAAKNNTNYGGSLINQKYSPLVNISLDDAVDDIFNRRGNTLSEIGAFPKVLNLYSNWAQIEPAVDVAVAPMVVISSNRATWMAKLLENAQNRGPINYNDAKPFDEGETPWYAPWRSGGRTLYIIVHSTEYDYYVTAIVNAIGVQPNIHVVGWNFSANSQTFDIVGFGASRFAAIQMVKFLGYNQAWAVDDNVVNINGFPASLDIIEQNMTADITAIGFSAATNNIDVADLYGAQVTFAAKAFDFGGQEPGLLQQVVLWNLKCLKEINFSPYFVTSNEDVSFTNYLQRNDYIEKIIKPLSIIKLSPDNDVSNNGGRIEIPKRRTRMMQIFYNLEYELEILPMDGVRTTLNQYVKDTILPNCLDKGQSSLLTHCRSVEQVLAFAVKNFPVPNKVFDPYDGFAGTQVQLLQPEKI